MDFTLQLDRSHGVLLITFGATLTDEIYAAAYAAIASFMRQRGPHNGIVDFSPVRNFGYSRDLLRLVAHMRPAIPVEKRRIAIAPQPEIYSSARIVQELRLGSLAPLEIVRTLAEATALLKIGNPRFAAVGAN